MRKTKKFKKSLKFTCFLISFTILSASLYFSSNRILEDLAVKSFSSSISGVSYKAIEKIVLSGYDYTKLISVSKDNDGNINMVTTNSLLVNSLATSAANLTYELLKEEAQRGVSVPLGAFTGIRLISGFGKKIKMKLISVASVKCEIISEFSQAGINQTRHTIYFNLHCTVSLITKTSSKTASDKIMLMVYDNVIVGKVPSVYLNTQVIGSGKQN